MSRSSSAVEVVHLDKLIYQVVFVTTVALSCQYAIANNASDTCTMQTSGCKSALAQYKRHYYLAPPQSLLRKQIKTKLMPCKPLFIVHGRV